jgi:hypothetical protein
MNADVWIRLPFVAIIVAVGGLIGYHTLRSWRRTRSRPVVLWGIGLILVLVGAIVSGASLELLEGNTLATMETVSLGFAAAGFVMILYSLYTRGS